MIYWSSRLGGTLAFRPKDKSLSKDSIDSKYLGWGQEIILSLVVQGRRIADNGKFHVLDRCRIPHRVSLQANSPWKATVSRELAHFGHTLNPCSFLARHSRLLKSRRQLQLMFAPWIHNFRAMGTDYSIQFWIDRAHAKAIVCQ
jgi:hypothetical protein